MPIYRAPHNASYPYTVIDNGILGKSSQLSLKARGLLCTMLAKPSDWSFSIAGLSSILPNEGKDSVRRAITELEQHGFVVREKPTRNPDGTLKSQTWHIHERPGETQRNPRSKPP